MSKIKSIDAMEILDSRGNPTIQVSVALEQLHVRSLASFGRDGRHDHR